MSRPPGDAGLALPPGLARREAVARVTGWFAGAGLDTPALDARLLAAAALGLSAGGLLASSAEPVGPASDRLLDWARRRLAREPIARILGVQEFWSLPFRLSPETLIPRPDSETVVAAALEAFGERAPPRSILDLGSGSGCLLVALLHECPRAYGVGVDRSEGALRLARENAAANGVDDRAAFVAADWLHPVAGRFDLVVSNPPYIRHGEIEALAPEVAVHDPAAALDGGDDGLAAYRAILPGLAAVMAADGVAVLELGHDQAAEVAALGRGWGFVLRGIRRDLGGHERAVVFGVAEPAST